MNTFKTTLTTFILLFTTPAQAAPVPGDINNDGAVNFADFLILAQNFGKTGTPGDPGPITGTDTLSVASLNQIGFPLAIGNTWHYQFTAIENGTQLTSNVHRVEWEVEAHETIFDKQAYRVKNTQTLTRSETNGFPTTESRTFFTWLTSTATELTAVGNDGDMFFADGQLLKPVTGQVPYPWAYNMLTFPLTPGKTWNVHNIGNSYKTVLGTEIVTVPAGTFETYKVRVVHIPDSPQVYIIWYSAIGIVKIISVTPPNQTHGSQNTHTLRIYELVSYKVN